MRNPSDPRQRRPILGLGLLLAALAAGPARAGDPAPRKPACSLPDDPAVAVITLDHVGGLAPPRKTKAPYLSFLADGRVRAVDLSGRGRDAEGHLSLASLRELLAYVIETERFFSAEDETLDELVRRRAREAGAPPAVLDASTTRIDVQTREQHVRRELYALRSVAERFPDLERVQRLDRVARRLENEAAVVLAGGLDRVRSLMEEANRRLQAEHPGALPLAAESLRYQGTDPDDVRRFTLRATEAGGADAKAGWSSAAIRIPPAPAEGSPAAPTIDVAAGP